MSQHKPVMIVNEYYDETTERSGLAIDGAQKSLVMGLCRQAGIDKQMIHITNVVNRRPAGNRLEGLCGAKEDAIPGYRAIAQGKWFHNKFAPELERLYAELDRVRPNVIIAMGNLSLWALCKKSGIKRYRGSPLPTFDEKYKVIPTWAPSSIFRQWENRIVTLSDFTKAKDEAAYPEIRRPERYIYLEPTLEDIEAFYQTHLLHQEAVSVDIETKNLTITEVGVGTLDGKHCLVIPFWDRETETGNYWKTLNQEVAAWTWVRRICTEFPTFGQNYSYDMQYFWRTMGIPNPRFCGDTMLLHHSMQPELEKGLGFLGSVYTIEPSWKFMRTDHATMKREDD